VLLNKFDNCSSPSKVKPCTKRGPEIGTKILKSFNVQDFDNQVNAVFGPHMKGYRNKWKTTSGQSQLG
jgi:hypothetical protein